MLERETKPHLPKLGSAYSYAENLSPNLVHVFKGVDVISKKTHSLGDRYEEDAFMEIMKRNQRLVGVGPHMLDEALGKCDLSKEARPDTLLLSRNFCLLEMVEFKSGKSNGLHRKIEGFTSLLDRLRDDPYLLPSLLNEVLEKNGIEDKAFPRIHVPENSNITVRFVSPYFKEPIMDGSLPFKVRFSVIERQN